ncbi:MAG: carotenoid oxygenase family protein, partial [Sphingomonadaceae bacterium]
AADLVIEGRLPETLSGTFYRNGPDPQYPPHPDDRYHVFDGDGMIYAIRLHGGRASLRNRYVRTRKFELERAAGRRLFGVFGNPRFNDPSVSPMEYNTANTHIWPHAGALYALMEGCPPTAMDPETLETKGYETFANTVTGPFTAHPKTDPADGAMHAFGYSAKGPGSTAIRYNIIDRNGTPRHLAWLDQPYPSMMHDFALTGQHVVFPCLPVVISMERAMEGKPMAAWEGDRPAAFGVMDKGGAGGDSVRWFETDPTFAFHIANSYEDGQDIVIDVAGSRRAPLMPGTDGTLPSHEETRFTLRRWRLGGNGNFREEAVDGLDIQFPRIDDRVQGQRYRKVFVNGTARPTAGRVDGFDMVAAIDVESGTRDGFSFGEGAYCGEPVFVADGPGEGEGWLLSLVWDSQANESFLAVLDARNVAAGPVARVHMPARVPGGFHCHWRDAA